MANSEWLMTKDGYHTIKKEEAKCLPLSIYQAFRLQNAASKKSL